MSLEPLKRAAQRCARQFVCALTLVLSRRERESELARCWVADVPRHMAEPGAGRPVLAWLRHVLLSVLLGLGVSAPAADSLPGIPAAAERAQQLISAATNGTTAMHRLAELCDTFGPRLSGSTNLEAAIDWILSKLEADGFERVRGEKVLVPHWVRGPARLEMRSSTMSEIPVLALGGTVGTGPEGIEAPVLVVTNYAELEGQPGRAAGRIVVFNPPFISYGDIVRYRTGGANAAAKAGAVASLVRSATPFSLRTPHTGAMAYEDGIRKIPHAAIPTEDADRLARFQARGITPILRLVLEATTLPDAESRNVVAEIRGRERPDEVVVVGGHIDSWDVGQGTLDDAGGCLAAWEALRLIKASGQRPLRTLRLVLWTNEENGLRGAKAYAEAHQSELDRHVLAIESDSGIGPVKGFAFTGSRDANQRLQQVMPRLAGMGADGLKAGAGGADLGPLLRAGVPTMDLWTDRADYFWFHHSAADTVDKMNPVELNRCVAALAVMLDAVGNLPEPLPR
ncbi:MAG: M20/M25/M40 family metallo-hydrolase [Verrucomicrobiales bacterium]|nr:M20/M25/M40 family metallo-hydrolase [Verrucomicrobiales bacterium]